MPKRSGASPGPGRRRVLGGLPLAVGAALAGVEVLGVGMLGFGSLGFESLGFESLGSDARAAEPRLKGPVDVEARRRLRGRAMTNAGCPPPPPPIRNLNIEGVYTDPAYSKADPARVKRQQEETRALGQYAWKLGQLSDVWLLSRPPQTAAAQCVLAWLDSWASADALLGAMSTPDAEHQRKWTLAGVSLAFLKIQDAPDLDAAAMARVRLWFRRLSDASEAYYATWQPTGHNNHFYWLALAMAGTAVATNDAARLGRAFDIYDEAAQAITPDGALPLELSRKGRAFSYHVFSLIPLVFVAEFGHANGRDLYARQNGALHRLAKRVQLGLGDQSWFAQAAGVEQEWTGATAFTISWGEPYYARFPNPALGEMITAKRPIFHGWLGGSVTDSYGSPALPFPAS